VRDGERLEPEALPFKRGIGYSALWQLVDREEAGVWFV
jgi:hypothetical protein